MTQESPPGLGMVTAGVGNDERSVRTPHVHPSPTQARNTKYMLGATGAVSGRAANVLSSASKTGP